MKINLKKLTGIALAAAIAIGGPVATPASASLPSGSTYIGSHYTTAKGDEIRLSASQDSMSVYAELVHNSGDDAFSYSAKLQRYTQTSSGSWSWVTIDSTSGTLGVGQTKNITFYNIAQKNADMKILVNYSVGSTLWGSNYLYFTR